MQLHIQRKKTVQEIKKQFAANFPSLKLELFQQPHRAEEGSRLETHLNDDQSLAVLNLPREGYFFFKPSDTVAAFEQGLQNEFGIPVQVFRRSGDQWIETIQTDHLSLEKQNSMGQESRQRVRFNIHTLFL